MSLSLDLANINSTENFDKKITSFQKFISQYLGTSSSTKKTPPDENATKEILKYLVEQIGENEVQVSKPLLKWFGKEIDNIDQDYNEQLISICEFFIRLVGAKASYFVESLIPVARLLAELHQSKNEFSFAGKAMCTIDTEDQYVASVMTLSERCDWRIQTAEYFLADEDNTSATIHIQKSRKLLRDIDPTHSSAAILNLRHKTCYSRILDSERKFLSAAVNYLEISQLQEGLGEESGSSKEMKLDEEFLLQSLENAVKCAILGKAGGARTRVLQMLYRDERTRQLKNFKVLEKVNKGMILSKKEQDEFSCTLSDHHQAVVGGGLGLTVLEKSMFEHNMLAASKLYKNIKIRELALLLGVNEMQAEDLARVMIQEGRMPANIDQVDAIIEFDNDEKVLGEWDMNIQDLCMSINDVCDLIDIKHPNVFEIP